MGIPIPGAYASPRISNGVLCWYAGDTFSVVIQADLVDQDGAAVDIGATDTVKITFRDDTRAEVWSKTFSNVENNQVTLVVDAEISAKFPTGRYTYDVEFSHGDRTTLARDNKVRVE